MFDFLKSKKKKAQTKPDSSLEGQQVAGSELKDSELESQEADSSPLNESIEEFQEQAEAVQPDVELPQKETADASGQSDEVLDCSYGEDLPEHKLDKETLENTKELLNTPDHTAVAKAPTEEPEKVTPKDKPEKKGFFGRMREGLSKTRSNFTEGISSILLGKKEIDDDLMEELETQLIMADIGVEATQEIIDSLTKRVSRKELKDSDALYAALIDELGDMLSVSQKPLIIDSDKSPYVILMVGINGVGKTTTIGKLAKQYKNQGKSVMLAAGDTFRAAAVEQLQVWGERNDVPVIAQHTGADAASVLFDAVQAAKARNADILIADTAGRLHNKDNLMQELEKVVRVIKKIDETAPHEVMLVLDAGTGQNAINQTKQFMQSVGVTGLTLTKLDGTAKGGIVFALAKQFGLPVRFIGVGEGVDDLRPFNADEFSRALFAQDDD